MRRFLLAINEHKPVVAQPRNEGNKAIFGGVASVRKHGFAEKTTTYRSAVQPSDECFVFPNFDRMSVPRTVQGGVSGDKTGVNPRAVLVWSCGIATMVHNCFEAGIESDVKSGFFEECFHAFGHPQFGREKHHSRVGRKPK